MATPPVPAAPLNVLGGPLAPCSTAPRTGWLRDGYCQSCAEDIGRHTVCAVMTAEFLAFSAYVGNDLETPRPELDFPGLVPGDRWCICAQRFLEAHDAGCPPPVILEATHAATLEVVALETLRAAAHPA